MMKTKLFLLTLLLACCLCAAACAGEPVECGDFYYELLEDG